MLNSFRANDIFVSCVVYRDGGEFKRRDITSNVTEGVIDCFGKVSMPEERSIDGDT